MKIPEWMDWCLDGIGAAVGDRPCHPMALASMVYASMRSRSLPAIGPHRIADVVERNRRRSGSTLLSAR